MEPSQTLRQWGALYAPSIVLVVAGLLLVAAGVWAVDGMQTVSTVLVVFGAGMVIIGALLPRLEGGVTLSVQQGLKFTLAAERATERKAVERQLSPEKTEEAVRIAIEAAFAQWARPIRTVGLSHGTDAIVAAPTAEAIASAAVERVIDLDAAREERRRMGQDVDNEPVFEDIKRKLDSGEPLTPPGASVS